MFSHFSKGLSGSRENGKILNLVEKLFMAKE